MPRQTSEKDYVAAEKRLGRQLSESERRIDLLGYDRDLERGKRRLVAAIEVEKRRVIRAWLRGDPDRLRVTPAMVEALAFLRRRGRVHARKELRAAGVEPSREYASEEELSALGRLLEVLAGLLGRVTKRVEREVEVKVGNPKQIDLDLSTNAQRKLARAMERRVPGSLSIAGQLVSGAMAAGLAEGFEGAADLFPCWQYSAVMDGATCEVCRALDGTRYRTWRQIMVVLPDGGPNPACLGNGRCRCRPVPCSPGERA